MAMEDEIKAGIEKKVVVIGSNIVLKKLKQGKLSRVILAANCSPVMKKEAVLLCEAAGLKVEESKLTNMDLGALCKKSFGISLIGFVV